MLTEREVRVMIKKLEDSSRDLLDRPSATVEENAPVAVMQLDVTAKLRALYVVLDEQFPDYECCRRRKT